MRRLIAILAMALPAWAAQPVHARHAMVVTVEQHATDTGVAVLQAGGNAVDAAVAVGFALAVTHPRRQHRRRRIYARASCRRPLDVPRLSRARAGKSFAQHVSGQPGKPTQDSVVGYRAAGVPGTVRGLEYASKKYGRKTWAEVMRPP